MNFITNSSVPVDLFDISSAKQYVEWDFRILLHHNENYFRQNIFSLYDGIKSHVIQCNSIGTLFLLFQVK